MSNCGPTPHLNFEGFLSEVEAYMKRWSISKEEFSRITDVAPATLRAALRNRTFGLTFAVNVARSLDLSIDKHVKEPTDGDERR